MLLIQRLECFTCITVNPGKHHGWVVVEVGNIKICQLLATVLVFAQNTVTQPMELLVPFTFDLKFLNEEIKLIYYRKPYLISFLVPAEKYTAVQNRLLNYRSYQMSNMLHNVRTSHQFYRDQPGHIFLVES